jgi:hypothetical protein
MKRSIYISCIGAGLLASSFSSLGTTVNLLTVGTSGLINGAQYVQGNGGSGTGVFPAFVQISGSGAAFDPAFPNVRQGYNTTANNTFDNGSSATFNHEITFSQLPIFNFGGISYYSFLLDINENNNAIDRFLSLDDVKIFTSTTANQSTETLPPNLGTLRYDMDGAPDGDSRVLLDYTLNPGSGQYDMELRVPTANFAGALGTDFVYLYSKFGVAGINPAAFPAGDYGVSDGFEEWAFNPTGGTTRTPDGGATLMLLGVGLAALGAGRRFLKF